MSIFNEDDYFEALNGRKFKFVEMTKPTIMKVWENICNRGGVYEDRLGGIDVHNVDVETLKKNDIWNQLSAKIQEEVINRVKVRQEKIKEKIKEKMSEIRRGRKQKYPNMPREIICTECHAKTNIAPSILNARLENLSKKAKRIVLIQDYLKNYKCRKCRKKNKIKIDKIKLQCKCGKKIMIEQDILNKRIVKLGVSIDDYIMDFQCQKCHPTKGRKKKGSKIKNIELKCKCGHTVTYPSNYITQIARKKDMEVNDYIKNYECQKCHPTKGRPKKIK